MPESSANTASSTGAQAADRLYTAHEVRVLMLRALVLVERLDLDSDEAVVDAVLADDEAHRG